jgi:regulator of RNase E activity RraA
MATSPQPLAPADFERLQRLDTPSVSNAIERFDVRTRNEGFIHGTARCVFPDHPPMLGYAVTAQVRTALQPIAPHHYYDQIDFWAYLETMPAPHVIVLQDLDPEPGVGALFGELHAAVARSLHSVGCVTNGAVRDLQGVEALKFRLFAGGVSPTHAYAHIVHIGGAVEIGGLIIRPGDLLHADRHGVVSVPLSIAANIPAMAERLQNDERDLLDFCRSPDVSLKALRTLLAKMQPKILPGLGPIRRNAGPLS